MSVQLTVDQGEILGEKRIAYDGKEYYSFEGIPYAKPPLGKLRFRDPQPPDLWNGIRDCTKPGNKCAQIGSPKRGFEGSEDCLYLNVYTPCLPSEKLQKLPVILFIHGGRLTIGYGDYYKPVYLLRFDVIVVTINYRLHILGFLSLDTPEVPGNAGLKDCVAALRWVNRNIENFNGDKNNVTVFGESAGGAICTALLCSKMTIGLFHKMITQSGNVTADVFMCLQDHLAVAKRVAATLGRKIDDKDELLDFFRALPIEDLVKAYNMTKSTKLLLPLLGPVVEKQFPEVESFIHEPPLVTFQNNRFIKVPMICGSNMYEGAAFVFKNKHGITQYEKDFRKFVPNFLYLKDDDPKKVKIGESLKERYFGDKNVSDETKLEYIKMLSDTFFNRDITHFAELVSKHNDQLYAYKFNYVGNLSTGLMKSLGVYGTTHGDSIQYQFYRENKAKKSTDRDVKIVDFFSEAFTNFAKQSKPTWSDQHLQWRPYTPSEKLTLIVDEPMSLCRNEDWECFQFWNNLVGVRSKL